MQVHVCDGRRARARVLARARAWRWVRIEWRTRVRERRHNCERARLARRAGWVRVQVPVSEQPEQRSGGPV